MSRKIRYALIYLFLGIAAFIAVFPFYWMVVGSTNTSVDVNKGKLTFGDQFFINIQNLIKNFDLGQVFWNSIQVSFFVVILSVVASSMAGYGFEMYKSRGMKYVYGGTLLTLMVPFAALMVPVFRLMTYLNLIDSLWGVILPMIPSVFLIFFFKQNFQTYPREIIMAARVDGASELRIFFSIVMPSMKATYAAAAIYSFLTSWNVYLQPLVIIQSQEKRTMALFIANLASGYQPDFGLVMTAVVVATVPALILFFMLQRYFVQGVLGSIKQ